jgi:N-ethylmaleimide reductase
LTRCRHGLRANGYLPHQFLAENINRRTDRYGSSANNRALFLIEISTAVAERRRPRAAGTHVPVYRHDWIK